ncbi:hypothetical protein D9756_003033 [Leucocoprinus leucothites]|uniref:MADF domain-containing protein n=1 Tax=Leucocoprinus leucothites TaxID=201217 RepID=A0A8H5G6I3_9AGAR|nr:hypothetical protein D9756_003033 [Leucoagaricus leucothites]
MAAGQEMQKKGIFAENWKKIGFPDHHTLAEKRIRLLVKKHFDYNKKWTEQPSTKRQNAWNELCEYFPDIVMNSKTLQKPVIAYMQAVFSNRRSWWRKRQRKLAQNVGVQIKVEESEPEEPAAEVDSDYDTGGKVLDNQTFLFQGSVVHNLFLPSPTTEIILLRLRQGVSWLC